jgi:hypothetical protein
LITPLFDTFPYISTIKEEKKRTNVESWREKEEKKAENVEINNNKKIIIIIE